MCIGDLKLYWIDWIDWLQYYWLCGLTPQQLGNISQLLKIRQDIVGFNSLKNWLHPLFFVIPDFKEGADEVFFIFYVLKLLFVSIKSTQFIIEGRELSGALLCKCHKPKLWIIIQVLVKNTQPHSCTPSLSLSDLKKSVFSQKFP